MIPRFGHGQWPSSSSCTQPIASDPLLDSCDQELQDRFGAALLPLTQSQPGATQGLAVQLGKWKLPITVPQKKLNIPRMLDEYSVVYQKVQSSCGSTAMLL